MSYSTHIGKFISENKDWKEILSNEPYNLKISCDGEYVLLKYDMRTADFSSPIVRESRGIIFKVGEWEYPVCHPFNKFFNYGETFSDDVDWNRAVVSEKIDGSLMKLWFDDNRWHLSTNGSIDAYKTTFNGRDNTFGELFETALLYNGITLTELTRDLDRNYTYMFELVSPLSRIVIPYETTDIYYLGCRNKWTDKEYPFFSKDINIGFTENIKTPKVYRMNSLSQVLTASADLPWDEEGYVVCDKLCNRVKIKSPKYVLAHYHLTNRAVSFKNFVQIVVQGEVEEFKQYAVQHTLATLNRAIEVVNRFRLECENAIKVVTELRSEDRSYIASVINTYPSNIKPFMFLNIEKDFSFDEWTSEWEIGKWMKFLRRYIDEDSKD